MAGCDVWSTFKILELALSVVCVIYKRVNDDEASRLYYYLTKISREWPLLNNITWDQSGAIFTDVTYGGYVFISAGLLLAHCTGELDYAKRLETFFLIFGALSYIVVGSVLLAAIEWVPNELIDNAAILGTISLITAFVFIVDLLSAGTRRKRRKELPVKIKQGIRFDKSNQTDGLNQVYSNGDSNGYIKNGFVKTDQKKIPKNSVKILPTSPTDDFETSYPVTNSNHEYVGMVAPPFSVYTPTELKNPANQIKSTESFLKSEKGDVPVVKRSQHYGEDGEDRTPTPPGYAKVKQDKSNVDVVVPTGYVMVPIQELSTQQLMKLETSTEQPRKLQSPTVTTTVRTPQGYFVSSDSRMATPVERKQGYPQAPQQNYPSSGSDESLHVVYTGPKDASHVYRRSHTPSPDDGDVPPMFNLEYPQKKYTKKTSDYGKLNLAYTPEDEVDFRQSPFQRNSHLRSSNYSEKPKGILRSEEKDKKKQTHQEDNFSSLDSRKIADDLKRLKDATNSSADVAQLEKENRILKENLKKEKEEKYQLKTDLKLEIVEQRLAELDDRKQLERRIQELEQLKNDLKLAKGFRDYEEEKRLELKIKEMEEEKDRRMSEREEHYFGIIDLKKSQKDVSPEMKPKLSDLEDYFRAEVAKKGAQEINARLKEKTKEEEEIKKVIEEGFHFLDEEKKKTAKMKLGEKLSAPDLTSVYIKSGAKEVPKKYESSDEDRGSTSYKSEAQFWLSSEAEDQPEMTNKDRADTPSTPRDPGYVLHAAKYWEGKTSPLERFQFSSQKAQQLKVETTPKPEATKIVLTYDDETKIPPKMIQYIEIEEKKDQAKLLDYEENMPKSPEKIQGRRSGMLVRKVDFPDHVTVREIHNTPTVGSTSTWKKWLQPKPKLAPSRSYPN